MVKIWVFEPHSERNDMFVSDQHGGVLVAFQDAGESLLCGHPLIRSSDDWVAALTKLSGVLTEHSPEGSVVVDAESIPYGDIMFLNALLETSGVAVTDDGYVFRVKNLSDLDVLCYGIEEYFIEGRGYGLKTVWENRAADVVVSYIQSETLDRWMGDTDLQSWFAE